MSWTTSISTIQRTSKGDASVAVTYNNGTMSITETYSVPDMTNLKAIVQSRVNSLVATDNFVAATVPGLLDVSIPTPPTPTPAQVAQAQFFTDYQQWLKVRKAIDVGILTGNEAPVVALQTKVSNEFKADPLNNLTML